MYKIAIAGFQHETNTFSKQVTTYEDFVRADNWPGLSIGEAIFLNFTHSNIPITGFINANNNNQTQHELLPLLWCSASPAGKVSKAAYEKIIQQLLEQLKSLADIDALFLDLHGAMVCEHLQDGEGELLQRIRDVLGDDVPIIVSLDFHANITQAMFELSDALLVYRTYPHVDMAEIGHKCYQQTLKLLDNKNHVNNSNHKAYQQFDFLIPLTSQCTLIEPAQALYQELSKIENKTNTCVSLALGFPLADIKDAGPAAVVYGDDAVAVQDAIKQIKQLVLASKPKFKLDIHTPESAIQQALADTSAKPVVLADTQDNPGGGGSGDTVGLLKALIKAKVSNAIVAMVVDQEVAEQAHAASIGASIELSLGAKSGVIAEQPLVAVAKIINLSNGQFTCTGAYYKDCQVDLGLMAHLDIAGVEVIVASKKMQAGDQAIFQHLNIDLSAKKILGLKSSVHFRADFTELASQIIVVAVPGINIADLHALEYQCLRADVDIL